MRELVIDCATEACSVALFEDGALLAGEFMVLGRGHAERLVPMIESLPGKGRADRICVDSGPGSFTGIRVGLAAARALAFAWQVTVEGYSSLSLVAAMAGRDWPAKAIDVVMNGGHGEWFFQPFAADGTPLASPASLLPEAVIAVSAAGFVAGSQADALGAARSVQTASILPDARLFSLLPVGALTPDPLPSYGRAPDARLPLAG